MPHDSSDMPVPGAAPVETATSMPERSRRAAARAPRLRRVSLFVQEPFAPPRTTGLRAGVICDGTTRGGPNGIAQGAARVVECSERCAERGDVALFAAFILSPQNLVRRATPFFAGLHAEFLRLLEGVAAGRALRGIRVEVEGRLNRLRSRGGAAARLANTIELLVEATSGLASPRARLVMGIDYGEDAPLALGLDVLVRTGMEEANVLRLSGLRVQKSTICIPTPTLWRDFTPADLDSVLSLAVEHARTEPAAGFSSAFVREFASEMARAGFPSPLRILLPVAGRAPDMLAALGLRGFRRAGAAGDGAAHASSDVAVTAGGGPGKALRRIGPRGARVEIHLLERGEDAWPRAGEPIASIVPGQSAPVLRLLNRSARDANIHVCEPTPRGLVEGVRAALRFQAAHPPLHGAPRPRKGDDPAAAGPIEELMRYVARAPDRPAEALADDIAKARGELPSLGLTGDVFGAKCLLELRSSGLVSGEVDWGRQAFGYALTAFGIGYRHPEPGGDWESPARNLARAMLAMASSDEEISDRVFDGEAPDAHRARLAASVEHLLAAVRGQTGVEPAIRAPDGPPEPGDARNRAVARVPAPVPEVQGAAVLEAIAGFWRGFFAARARTAHPAILEGARRAVEGLYRANLEELTRADALFSAIVRRSRTDSLSAIEQRISEIAPEPVARRLRDLARAVAEGHRDPASEAVRELRLLCRLARVAPSIGAGCAFLVMASTEPAGAVPAAGAAALLRATPIINHAFRLANNLAFTDATRGNRDDKPNAFTCLVPSGLTGKARERASADALRTCRTTAAWLEAEIRAATADLSQSWPLAAGWLVRGMHVGRRAYQSGHYDRLAPSAIAGIVAELDPPRSAPRSGR